MTEVHVLEAIKNVEVATMGNVAQKLRVTLGTLTTSINVLVRKKYVERYRDESDRRRVFLVLTKQAHDVLRSEERRVGKECRYRWLDDGGRGSVSRQSDD